MGDVLLALLLEFNGALDDLIQFGWCAVEQGQEMSGAHAVWFHGQKAGPLIRTWP